MANKDFTDEVFDAAQSRMRKESISSEIRKKGVFATPVVDIFKESRKNALERAYHPKNDPKGNK